MTDINTIKNLLDFIPYLKGNTWDIIGIGIVIYIIYIAYIMAFERYYKIHNSPVSQKKTFHETIDTIQVDDVHFFEHLSFIIRSHLEDSEQVLLATKKTRKDIYKESASLELKEILNICTYHEYTQEKATTQKKMEILEQLKNSI